MSALEDLFPGGFTPAVLNALPGKPADERPRENLFFEFKEKWNPRYVAKSVSAFANASGGYLLIGATQESDGTLAGLPGVERGRDWAKEVSDNVVGHISPLPGWEVMPFPAAQDGKVVVVVRVQESWATPHIVTDSGSIYLRSPGGTSEAITDRATLDRVIERGRRGEEAILARIRAVQRRPESQTPWRLLVTSVPLPYGSAHQRTLFTKAHYEDARLVFHPADTLLRDPQIEGVEEEAVRIDFVNARGWVYEDGVIQVVYGWDTATVSVPILADVMVRVPLAQRRLTSPVHAARVVVRFEAEEGVSLSEAWRIEGYHGPAPRCWEWSDDVPVGSPEGIDLLSRRFQARLWRSIGKPVFLK